MRQPRKVIINYARAEEKHQLTRNLRKPRSTYSKPLCMSPHNPSLSPSFNISVPPPNLRGGHLRRSSMITREEALRHVSHEVVSEETDTLNEIDHALFTCKRFNQLRHSLRNYWLILLECSGAESTVPWSTPLSMFDRITGSNYGEDRWI